MTQQQIRLGGALIMLGVFGLALYALERVMR